MAELQISTPAPGRAAQVRAGFLAVAPLWLGAAPFGVIYAVSALAAGLSPAQTLAMSLFVFAGASQFTAAGMFAAAAAPAAIVVTTLIINARHLLLAASLAPYLRRSGGWVRLGLAAQLTDESYAIGVRQFLGGRGSAAYQLGANLSMYVVWQLSTLAGVLLGRALPDPAAYGLDLVFPLTFIGLLVPLLRRRDSQAVAAAAAALTLLGALWLPGSWYILLAGMGASAVGALLRLQIADF
ncbi:AzlC family ABC transporter permease [Oscillochloris sp. ZM17-4]|uniref:AzlC family ABC transporter permease n=1 Tax=Oscillochloris sp. ZM17-4 TaxID=2866714 RepID=UPI001C7325AF|nr:AzlC family ABC transporter permease [Oscillochloris sp. ZM17-4]MBX0331346.1 AzlC family ABC transporter permease [Oscillochloris sp. ZM17-4]